MRGAPGTTRSGSRLHRWVVLLSALALVLGITAFLLSLSGRVGLAAGLAWFGVLLSLGAAGVVFQAGRWPWPALGGFVLSAFVLLRVHGLLAPVPPDAEEERPAPKSSTQPSPSNTEHDTSSTSAPQAEGSAPLATALDSELAAAEQLTRPGPVALSVHELSPAGNVTVGARVAAPWDGMWFEARITQLEGDQAQIHFVGWEPAWDVSISVAELYALPPGYEPPPVLHLPGRVGAEQAIACSLLVVIVPLDSVAGDCSFDTSTSTMKRYALRIDLDGVDAKTALGEDALADSALSTAPAFGLAYSGGFKVPEDGTYFFALDAGGQAELRVDGSLVHEAGVRLAAGSHTLQLKARLDAQAPLRLRLRLGSSPDDLRVLDMARSGDARVARSADGTLRLVIDEAVLFRPGSAELDPAAAATLERLWSRLETAYQGHDVTVEGHTDDLGSEAANMELSHKRAQSVGGWLQLHGQPATRIQLRAFGETRPRVANSDAEHRAQNRRVEFVFSAQH